LNEKSGGKILLLRVWVIFRQETKLLLLYKTSLEAALQFRRRWLLPELVMSCAPP